MEHGILAVDWSDHTLFILSRQLVKEVLDWSFPEHRFIPDRHLARDYQCRESDLGYVVGVIETRLDRELGIWIDLRRHLDIPLLLDGDAAGLIAGLHDALRVHFGLHH